MSSHLRTNAWFISGSAPAARLRLYCFPYAGGNAAVYQHWQATLAPHIEVCAIQLPGRAGRFRDPPYYFLAHLIKVLAAEISRNPSLPFAFFGHSVGALVAFELARHLQRAGLPNARWLFASGRSAPRQTRPSEGLHRLSDAALLDVLKDYDGTPPEVLAHRELMQLVLPTLRADFSLSETYTYQAAPPLDIPISVFAGRQDEHGTDERAYDWQAETLAACRISWFDGGHFFINTQTGAVLRSLQTQLAALPELQVTRPQAPSACALQ